MPESKERALSKKDLNIMALQCIMLQSNFHFERMQGTGFGAIMAPTLKKVYKDDTEGLANSLSSHVKFLNTHPTLVPFIVGLVASMEEEKVSMTTVNAVKNAIFPPLAGIGDVLIWFTVLPISAGIGASIGADGSFLGVIVFFLINFTAGLLRWPMAHLGYNMGEKAINLIRRNVSRITTASCILGVTVLGALIAAFVRFRFSIEIPLSPDFTFDVQTGFFDQIFPNIVPLGLTFLVYFLFRKRRIKPVTLITGIIVLCILFAYIGIA